MSQQIVINIEDSSIVPTICKMLKLIKGVTVLRQSGIEVVSYANAVSPTSDEWWNEKANVEMVNQGIQEANEGKCTELTLEEIKKRLGE